MTVPDGVQFSVAESLITNAPQSRSGLPAAFPNVEMPKFQYGDRVRWISEKEITDRGIVIGRFYSFAPHCDRWCWCYLIWLDSESPSSAWIRADIAWEDDLEICNGTSADDSIRSDIA